MNYREYKEKKQAEFNALPIFYAFSDEQFMDAMKERGFQPRENTSVSYYADKVYSLGYGGFYLKKDAEQIREYFNKEDELAELIKDYDFAFDAFYYEMRNHEYHINYYQGNWDVISCFDSVEYDESDHYNAYFEQLDWADSTKQAYVDARRKYLDDAMENEWI